MATSINILDVEDETILTAVFKDSFPDSWRENPDFALYLAELSSYGVDKLGREPERLAEDRAQILQQTQELAFHNYKTFIETADCSREIVEDFNLVEQRVNSVLDKLPVFSEKCNNFMTEAQQISASRRMNSLTLAKHTQLLEILEVPQLMDTCVRNGYYEEALELASYAKRLEKKHASIPVIQDIVKEVKSSTQLMLNQILQQLRTTIQLPACLRLIGYLRRMDLFSESELRIKFLQARDAWFQGILSAIPRDDAYYHISKVIEASRVHLFDIITQYRAIFSDDDPILASSGDTGTNEAALFHGWVVQKVSQFLHILEADLQKGVGGRLDSLLGQCMYFGLSFSRVGADFRGLLAPHFQRAALNGFTVTVTEATKRLEQSMQSYTLIATPSLLSSTTLSAASLHGDKNLAPPLVLMDHPPLATYCNNILSAFNELRLCAPVALACDVAMAMQESLDKVIQSIAAYHRAEESTFNQKELALFVSMCEAAAYELVPYMDRCLQALFPPAIIAQTLGISQVELQKQGPLGTLDINHIIEPLEPLLPVKIEEPEPEPVQLDETTQEQESLATDDLQNKTEQLKLTSEETPSSGTEPVTEPESESLTQTQQGSPSAVKSSLATIGEDLEDEEDVDKETKNSDIAGETSFDEETKDSGETSVSFVVGESS